MDLKYKDKVKRITYYGFPLLLFFIATAVFGLAGNSLFHSGQGSAILNSVEAYPQKISHEDSLVNKILLNADNLFKEKKYDLALAEYEKALKIRPDDKAIQEKIRLTRAAQSEISKPSDEFSRTIKSADDYFTQKDYLNAKASYQVAIDMRPNDEYAKARLKETMDLLRSQKAQNILYDVTMASAEKLFEAKDYEKAKEEFESAGKILPGEKAPKDRINEIIRIQAEQKTNEELYSKAIADADKFYDDKNFSSSLQKYKEASSYKPDETYPKDRIKILTSLLADLQVKDEKYRKSISSADNFYDQSAYSQAKTEYQNASSIKPDESYPQERIKAIDDLLAGRKRTNEDYNRFIGLADSLYINKMYLQAKSNYQQALKIKPGESYPKEMISKADEFISVQLADEKVREEAYRTAIAGADRLFDQKSYDAAKSGYQDALNIKPDEKYPKERISAIDAIAAATAKQKDEELAAKVKAATEEHYRLLIVHADSLKGVKSYDQAKTEYTFALALKPKESYPKQKIAEIDKALAAIAVAKNREDQYSTAIIAADKLFSDKSYIPAKNQYQAALKIKPDESYPKSQIIRVDSLLADMSKLKALDDQYQAGIKKADKLYSSKSWGAAKSEYIAAGNLKPLESYPKDKIAEIDKILTGIAEDKARDENYQKTLANADKLLDGKSYEEAKSEYANALKIKPGERYPSDKISEIDNILGKIAAARALDDQYAGIITQADKLLGDKSYDLSKAEYQKALGLKPAETYPKTKIAEIDNALDGIKKQKDLDDRYTSLVAEGDKLFNDKSWNPAKDKYTAALALKPSEEYPKTRITDIEKIFADQKALDDKYNATVANADKLLASKTYDKAREEFVNAGNLKPEEKYPKDKIAEIDRILGEIAHQKEVDEQYHTAVAKADQLLAAKSYIDAKTEYTNASNLKPSEEYPKTKLAVIEKIFADQKALDDQYNTILAKADKLFSDKSYAEAKTEYLNAGKLKPEESLPKDKVTEVDKIMAEIERQRTILMQYKASVDKADKYFNDKQYSQAKAEYENAGTIKPDEQYPKDKIAAIEGILAEMKAKDDAYKASISKADQLFSQKSWDDAYAEYQNAGSIKPEEKYPKDKMAEVNKILADIKGKRQTFDDLVQKGNTLFGQNDLYKAKETFQQALAIFPDENYPKARISRINTMVDSIYRANKGFYDKAVAEGDRNFNSLIFDKAIDSYNEALSYLPMENYPKEMISKIKKIITENAIVDVLKSSTTISNGSEQKFSFTPVNIASRKNNYLYIKIRNLSDKPFNILVRYGKDKQINGGAVIRNLAGDGKTYDRLISVREQDPWYREDNNWIGLVPQGGDVEVTFIQISRAQ